MKSKKNWNLFKFYLITKISKTEKENIFIHIFFKARINTMTKQTEMTKKSLTTIKTKMENTIIIYW